MAENPERYLLHPRAAKEILHAAYAEADYWLYPTGFTETYCITAVEAQYYRCVCVTTGLASLADTVADRGVLPRAATSRTPSSTRPSAKSIFCKRTNSSRKCTASGATSGPPAKSSPRSGRSGTP
jgi:hypothetical protein